MPILILGSMSTKADRHFISLSAKFICSLKHSCLATYKTLLEHTWICTTGETSIISIMVMHCYSIIYYNNMALQVYNVVYYDNHNITKKYYMRLYNNFMYLSIRQLWSLHIKFKPHIYWLLYLPDNTVSGV